MQFLLALTEFFMFYSFQGMVTLESLPCTSICAELDDSKMDTDDDTVSDHGQKEASFSLFAKFAKEVECHLMTVG